MWVNINVNGSTCASSVAGCVGQRHLRGPDSIPHKLPFSQEAAPAATRGTQRILSRGDCARAY